MMQDIGPKLKLKREQLGYRIEEVVEKTKVHPSAIHDIEENNFANISPAYLRGFIRLYAKFLNVDVDADLKEVPSTQTIGKNVKPVPAKPVVMSKPTVNSSAQKYVPPQPKPVLPPAPSRKEAPFRPAPIKPKPAVDTKGPLSYSQEDKPNPILEKIFNLPSPAKKALAIAIVAVLGIVLIAKGLPPLVEKIKAAHEEAVIHGKERKLKAEQERHMREEKKRIEKAKKIRHTAKREEEAQAANEEPESVQSTLTPIPQVKSKTITVSLTTKKDCFVRANVDGHTLFENVLRKGVAKTWRAQKEIDLKLSDGSAVIIDVNGSTIPALSTRTRVIKSLKINQRGISVSK
jgi:transcriptional regulator with XRE-family HTH domain